MTEINSAELLKRLQNDTPDAQYVILSKDDLIDLLYECANRTIAKKNQENTAMTVFEICDKFKLPKHKIRSRKWRIENNFPTHQDGAYTTATFDPKEVENWIKNNYR